MTGMKVKIMQVYIANHKFNIVGDGANTEQVKAEFYKYPFRFPGEKMEMRPCVFFEKRNAYTQQYIRLVTEIADFIEYQVRRKDPSNAALLALLYGLFGHGSLKTLYKESEAMGINPQKVAAYVVSRMAWDNFGNIFTILAGDQLNYINTMYFDDLEGVKCVTYNLTPTEAEERARQIKSFYKDELETDLKIDTVKTKKGE